MLDSILFWLKPLLKFGMPATLILYPLFALVGSLSVWKPAEPVLRSFANQTPILVAGGYSHHASGNVSSQVVSRGYVLFPSMFTDPKVVSIVQVNGAPPTVSETPGGFLYIFGWLVLCSVGTWWFWVRPTRPNGT